MTAARTGGLPPPNRPDRLVGRIEAAKRLDGPARLLKTAMARPAQISGTPAQRLGDALHGTWFGHPIHPMLVTLPIGAWTLAVGLDLLARLGLVQRHAADRSARTALKAGAAGAVAAAATGLADWQHLNGRARRVGLVHAAANGTALALMLLSLGLRRRGRRGAGQGASAAGWACMFAGGYLGGHLVYRRRIGVDHADRSPEPRDFAAVARLDELNEDRPRKVVLRDAEEARDVPVVLVRHRGRVHAMGARCSHLGGPLDQGWVLDGTLVCPWHGSRYALDSAQPASGPSTCAQPRYEVRLRDGMVEIRREQEMGDSRAMTGGDEPAPANDRHGPGRRADEVLAAHHDLFRELLARIEEMHREDPERRDLLRVLAAELDMHEQIEDHIFYPAVAEVSPDVPIAHSEHRQLSDLLAKTLKLNTASTAFEAHLRALRAAVDHHAGSEEHSMFRHAQRLGDARLRELGHALERMLEELRGSHTRRMYRDLKIGLLEGARARERRLGRSDRAGLEPASRRRSQPFA
ncbi:MAG TPA: DUF2231 domain-containing protein [Falsiroseomonas sp.]|jgi:nitrite reductase/ring-hydroxylating ferredoxin subunit/uncharacterized membrane protein|nr:DUF2231 domain-containing protein [Falsiroseomonas sp.]